VIASEFATTFFAARSRGILPPAGCAASHSRKCMYCRPVPGAAFNALDFVDARNKQEQQ
jgi:hypothetical protein